MSSTQSHNEKARRSPIWLILAAAGGAAFWLALDFGLGTAANIGSGIFPLALSALIVAISVFSFAFPRSERPLPLAMRPLVAVTGSVVLFILLVERIGLFPSVVLSMLTAYAGQTERRYAAFLGYAALFATGTWLVFSYALGMPVPFIEFR